MSSGILLNVGSVFPLPPPLRDRDLRLMSLRRRGDLCRRREGDLLRREVERRREGDRRLDAERDRLGGDRFCRDEERLRGGGDRLPSGDRLP